MHQNNSAQLGAKPKIVKQVFPVAYIRKEYNRWFYVIEVDGNEHFIKMFDFQKKLPQPAEIVCLIKSGANGQRVFSQDLAPIIASRYKVGSEYDFKIKESHQRSGQFDVMTPEGFVFHLDPGKNSQLKDRQLVHGRIRSMDGIKVNVEMLSVISANATSAQSSLKIEGGQFVSPVTIRDLALACGVTPGIVELVKRVFLTAGDFASARKSLENGHSEWLEETIVTLSKRMPQWLRGSLRNHKPQLLDSTRRICIDLVERSGLTMGGGQEEERLRSVVADAILTADVYKEALDNLDRNTADDFCENIISSLQHTGYIYEPMRRLRTMMAIFSLNDDVMLRMMPRMFSALSVGDVSTWKQEPIRSALVWMLNEYVCQAKCEADNVMDIELGENKQLLSNVVRSLGMILLLTADGDDINRHLLMSSLCRYASFFNKQLSQALNDRAYAFLFGRLPSQMPFAWNDLVGTNVGVVCFKLATCPSPQGSKDLVYYEGHQALISVIENSLTVTPLNTAVRLHNSLPNWVLPWRNMRVLVPYYDTQEPIRSTEQDTQVFHRLWRSVSDSVFAPKIVNTAVASAVSSVKSDGNGLPDVGDLVVIRITGRAARPDQNGNPLFTCSSVGEGAGVSGTISPRDIVHYNVISALQSDFEDADGKPLLFEAVVESADAPSSCRFSMKSLVGKSVSNMVEVGDQMRCKMTIRTQGGDSLLISEHGFSLKIPAYDDAPDLRQGEIVWVEVTQVYADGRVDATYLEHSDDPDDALELTDRKCFANILASYSCGVYEAMMVEDEDEEEMADDEDEMRSAQTEIEREEARELMSIVDRQSLLSTDRREAYNYLGMSMILARAIEDSDKAEEYEQRMHLIDLMQQYAINRVVDAEEFRDYYQRAGQTLAASKDLEDMASRILCISLLGRDDADDKLAEKAQRYHGSLTGEIAELALAYNIADRYGLSSAAHDISKCINSRLSVSFQDESHLAYVGEEGPQLEFKTTIVFPAGNGMRPDRKRQTTHILQRLAGLMNAKGGKLLVGVNDQGYAVGLSADFRDFADGHADYDEQKCRDKMSAMFNNAVVDQMPRWAAELITEKFEVLGDRTVYVIEVRASDRPVSVDGVFFRRYGTVTRMMSDEEVNSFGA